MQRFSGSLIFSSFLITIFAYFFNNEYIFLAGILAWFALITLFKNVNGKSLLYKLLALSFIAFSYSFFSGFEIDYIKVFSVNQYLLTLLIGVGFLRLIATPKAKNVKSLPSGKKSFFKTYLGVHLFGSVINLSSLIIVADKLYEKSKLTNLQVITLTRAFSSDAYWSPFFVAFAAAITYAPKLSSSIILMMGIILAFIAFLVTFFEIKNEPSLDEFKGYPIEFETLYLPFLLAILVLVTNYIFPSVKVILLISIFSLLLTFFILPLKYKVKKSKEMLIAHITFELPKMKNEIALFLIAGMFGVSISSVLLGMNLSLPIEQLNGLYASILLFILIALSFVGIHPIISIAVLGNWVDQLNHTLLAATFLMSWATAVSTSPFSGLNLTMQARYELKAKEVFKINLPYAIKMYFICVIMLFALSNYLGL
ncbi:tellurium resistance protein TerC [Halarcobacter bivalviorum]|uniref:Membrane protein n=1 Tax=Halarcobacter bivalviorum TaxID=663364 RepID=A0AAX2A9E2_9BACT|nr:tellurium resistance protein TerC [Halarcobacter bivalviorum]AXH13238.1 putative membrane protein [Halarcobacter bivalviorum]RXK10156.1 tellurium resistance protein TerC [Halarcobacter bivalviorum]